MQSSPFPPAAAPPPPQDQDGNDARRLPLARIACLFLVVFGLAAAAFFFGKRKAAQDTQSLLFAERALARSTASDADFRLACELWQRASPAEALPYLARSLRADPANRASLALAVSLLGQVRAPRVVLEHADKVNDIALSPDGSIAVTACRDHAARLWSTATGNPVGQPLLHGETVTRAVFSADGQKVATASADKTARIWNAATREPLTPPLAHAGAVNDVEFSPSIASGSSTSPAPAAPGGAYLVTASDDRTAQVWNAATGAPVGKPLVHSSPVKSAIFSPDGTRILTVSRDRKAWVWNAATGALLTPALEHEGPIDSAAFSPDGSRIVTASRDRSARLWDTQTGNPIGEPLKHRDGVLDAAFSPEGARVVTASLDRTARIWDAATGLPLSEPLPHGRSVNLAGFSPEGTRIVTACADGSARVWDARTGKLLGSPLAHRAAITRVKFSADGSKIITASADGTACLWDADAGGMLPLPLRHERSVRSAAFSPDGTKLVTTSDDHTARLWDATTGLPLTPPLQHEGLVTRAAFSPDGLRVVTASGDGTACLWNAQTGKPMGELLKHDPKSVVNSVAFSADGSKIVTASSDHTARLWDARTGQPIGAPMLHDAAVNTAVFNPDASKVLTASDDETVRLWDAATGTPIAGLLQPMNHEGAVNSAEFSPNGFQIVTAGGDGVARIWDAATGKPLGRPLKHAASVRSALFSPDGSKIVTASWDSTVRIWDAATGKPLTEPLRHTQRVAQAAWSTDGARIVSASEDGTARIWDAASGKLLESLGTTNLSDTMGSVGTMGRVNFAAFSPDGSRVVTASDDGLARVWNVLAPAFNAPDWFPGFLEAAARQRLSTGAGGFPEPLGEAETGKRFAAVRNLTDGDSLAKMAKWWLHDPRDRAIAPAFTVSLDDYINRKITLDGSGSALREARDAWADHPLVLIALVGDEPASPVTDVILQAAFARLKGFPASTKLAAARRLLQQTFPNAALAAISLALEEEPSNLKSLQLKADILWSLKRYKEGLAALAQTIQLDPGNATLVLNRAYRMAEIGLKADACADFERVLQYQINPEEKQRAHQLYGWALIHLNLPREAFTQFQQSAQLLGGGENDPDIQAAYSVAYWLAGDKPHAIDTYRKLVRINPNFGNLAYVSALNWPPKEKQAMIAICQAAHANTR